MSKRKRPPAEGCNILFYLLVTLLAGLGLISRIFDGISLEEIKGSIANGVNLAITKIKGLIAKLFDNVLKKIKSFFHLIEVLLQNFLKRLWYSFSAILLACCLVLMLTMGLLWLLEIWIPKKDLSWWISSLKIFLLCILIFALLDQFAGRIAGEWIKTRIERIWDNRRDFLLELIKIEGRSMAVLIPRIALIILLISRDPLVSLKFFLLGTAIGGLTWVTECSANYLYHQLR